MPSRIYPSGDLHLYPGAPPTPLRLFTMMTVWTDFLRFEGSSLTLTAVRPPPPAPAIATLVDNAIIPGVEGESLARLTATLTVDSARDSWDVAMRITVHHRLHALFVPRAHLTLETGRTDRVLTVYGQFASATNALSTFDVTRHGYLYYQVASLTGAADAVSVDPTGRVTTGANPGTARVIITVPGVAGVSTSIDIEVIAAVMDRPILVPRWTGSSIRKKSIVLVSEGFTDADQGRFDDLAFKIAEGLVLDTSPYSLVRESLDVYSAFVPSPESGLTIGPPVVPIASSVYSLVTPNLERFTTGVAGDFTLTELIARLGDPQGSTLTFTQASATVNQGQRQLSQIMFDAWRALGPPPPGCRVHETNVGLIMGERHDSTATEVTPSLENVDVAGQLLLPTVPNRTPQFDDRRLPDLAIADIDPDSAHVEAQDRFVNSLRVKDGPRGFGAVWASGGDSFGLVVYVANCDHYGGLGQTGYIGMSTGGMIFVQQVPSLVDGLFDVFPVSRPAPKEWLAAGLDRPIDDITNTLAHELGHSAPMGHLLDEYGGSGNQRPSTADLAHVDGSPNLQPLAKARLPNSAAIVARQLKWNWHRIAAACDVEQIVAQGTQLVITMITEDIMAWPENTIGRTAFLRERSATLAGTAAQSEALTIRAVDLAAQTITVDISPLELADVLAGVFKTNAVFYMPRIDASNNVLTLVDPAVIAAMSAGPFEPANPTTCVAATTKGPPSTIANYQFPADHNTVIAAYETGGQYDCSVIRPAAVCKMQSTGDATGKPIDFCFVCKYVIVEAIEPRSHGELDKSEYPRAPGTRVLP